MTRIGYARVSSHGQSYDEQSAALAAAGCTVIRAEKQSGKTTEGRDELETVLSFLRPDDVLCVTKLDRLARSLSDLLKIVDRIKAAGASLCVLQQRIDTATPAGRAFLHMLGLIAEFERELIHERQAAGIAAARREGRSLGGRRASIDRGSVRSLIAERVPYLEIARRLRIAPASVYRIAEELTKGTPQ